jgi:hypothetical protein
MNALDGKGFVNKLCKLFRASCLWILLGPYVIFGLGAASNQAVLIANHGKFPVMMNARQLDKIRHPGDLSNIINQLLGENPIPTVANDYMIDDVHCVMTKDTHLNFLADIFNQKDGIYSIGDFVLDLSEWLMGWTPFVWGVTLIGKAYRSEL